MDKKFKIFDGLMLYYTEISKRKKCFNLYIFFMKLHIWWVDAILYWNIEKKTNVLINTVFFINRLYSLNQKDQNNFIDLHIIKQQSLSQLPFCEMNANYLPFLINNFVRAGRCFYIMLIQTRMRQFRICREKSWLFRQC